MDGFVLCKFPGMLIFTVDRFHTDILSGKFSLLFDFFMSFFCVFLWLCDSFLLVVFDFIKLNGLNGSMFLVAWEAVVFFSNNSNSIESSSSALSLMSFVPFNGDI